MIPRTRTRTTDRFRTLPLAIAALIFCGLAYSADESASDNRYEQARGRMLDDVSNPERSFEFAEAAIAAGDLRGAAAALERILLIDPRLANIRLELGEIYLHMNDALLAQYHIREALRAPNVPESVRLRAQRLLAVASRAGSRNTVRLDTSLGYRHDSNANAGPSAGAVYALDPFTFQTVLVPLGAGGKTSDSSMNATAALSHSFALGGARGSSWDTGASAYGVWYSDLDDLSQISVGLETGPTWVVAGDANAPVSIRPFGLVGTAQLDGEDYYSFGGGGLAFTGFWSPVMLTQLRASYENRTFQDTPERFLSDRSGHYLMSEVQQIWQRGKLQLAIGATYINADARTSYQTFDQIGGQASARWFSVFGVAQRPWSVYAAVAYASSDYDSADAFINPFIVRADHRLNALAGAEVTVVSSLAVAVDLTHTANDSNLPNYEYDNFSAGVRAVYRF